MNQRIKELTGQVLDEIVPDTWTTLGYDKIKQIQYRTAELIVKECIALAQSHPSQNEDYAAGIDSVRESIKQHFGV